jgi:hypothetical protein
LGRQYQQLVVEQQQFEQQVVITIVVWRVFSAAVEPEPVFVRRLQQQADTVGSRAGAERAAGHERAAIALSAGQFRRFQCGVEAKRLGAQRSVRGAEAIGL